MKNKLKKVDLPIFDNFTKNFSEFLREVFLCLVPCPRGKKENVKCTADEFPIYLIDKNKIDIYDIPIVEITDQYMEYLHSMEKEDLGVMSEFLVMAATLLDIKCRMLLPKEINEEGEEEDPRAELVQKLLEYKMYKYLSYELRDRLGDAAGVYYRKQDLPGLSKTGKCN